MKKITSTHYLKKFITFLKTRIAVYAAILMGIFLFNSVTAQATDSADVRKPVIITSLEQSGIPTSMVARIKHFSPLQMTGLNEEYQHTDLGNNGEEIVTTVKLRFIENHITGYVKQALMSNLDKIQDIKYIDIPIEWMCIPPKQDHPFHFSSNLKELDSIKAENGCLDWVQRDNDVNIKFANDQKPKKKGLFSRSTQKTKN